MYPYLCPILASSLWSGTTSVYILVRTSNHYSPLFSLLILGCQSLYITPFLLNITYIAIWTVPVKRDKRYLAAALVGLFDITRQFQLSPLSRIPFYKTVSLSSPSNPSHKLGVLRACSICQKTRLARFRSLPRSCGQANLGRFGWYRLVKALQTDKLFRNKS
ncbi:hypothetical protein VFPPC_15552 [Pochonia chlamydosporia 170]|uniref:Uncharacterized protein n=1 Tax=Pochonia chlamydosporia 170 TaxID=1380566 RepID=A0A179FY96_METCM|nr:hypothetical protein VFPPC_15552 [Pochonia chlamydosporia 170]OAQ70208.1 hypothetical protein VFPPC_15552 [Pochonia chlamydosporia 170]